MVKIAIAGGSGDVGREILDVLIATGRHEILLLSRKDASEPIEGVTWVKTSYDIAHLTEVFQGVNTVLSFVDTGSDTDGKTQKTLIDASIAAGVKRFAPSEWATSNAAYIPWYANKLVVQEYLKEVNKDKKVLEYTLFQPGMFLQYLAYPYRPTKYLTPIEFHISYDRRSAIVVEEGGLDDVITVTDVLDLAEVVARAVEYEGTWPIVGGVQGKNMTIRELIGIGEKIFGSFKVETVKTEVLKTGVIDASWCPQITHPSIPPEKRAEVSPFLASNIILSIHADAWKVSDDWNRLLPDIKFGGPEAFLTKLWEKK